MAVSHLAGRHGHPYTKIEYHDHLLLDELFRPWADDGQIHRVDPVGIPGGEQDTPCCGLH
jgi:hypothetical protein